MQALAGPLEVEQIAAVTLAQKKRDGIAQAGAQCHGQPDRQQAHFPGADQGTDG